MGGSASVPEVKQPVENVKPKCEGESCPQPVEKPKLKACCACPETKKTRDKCIMEKGEENCGDLIEAHKKCMRDLGFKI